jgi:hypothetical protein
MSHRSESNSISRTMRASTSWSLTKPPLRQETKRRSTGRASSNDACGAGANRAAVPSRREILTKIAPARAADLGGQSSAPPL